MGGFRLLIFELRPPVLEEEGLIGALQVRLEAVKSRAGCQAGFNVEGEPHLSPEVETELYWAVHEALNNVLKHARAKHVYVDLQFHNGASKITIVDDGVGFNSTELDRISGIGIQNITERINRIGGSLKIKIKRMGRVHSLKSSCRRQNDFGGLPAHFISPFYHSNLKLPLANPQQVSKPDHQMLIQSQTG